jgi:acetyltransferase-like isoleucine patch superfamily enzyme
MSDANIGEECQIAETAVIGVKYTDDSGPAVLGNNAVVRSGSIIYDDVTIGEGFRTGHYVLVREATTLGDDVLVGTNTVIEGHVTVGNKVTMETNVYIPTRVSIGDRVFLGPNAVLTNDKYPLRRRERYEPEGPVVRNSVTIGANATVLPGVELGEGSIIAAGSTVTKDVPSWHRAIGVPAQIEPLPEELREYNQRKDIDGND